MIRNFLCVILLGVLNARLIFNVDSLQDGENLEYLKDKQGAVNRGEDSYFTSKISLAVCDGVGGSVFTAKHISSMVANKFTQVFANSGDMKLRKSKPNDFKDRVLKMVHEVTKEYRAKAEEFSRPSAKAARNDPHGKFEFIDASTTMVGGFLIEDKKGETTLLTAQIGDSSYSIFDLLSPKNNPDIFFYGPRYFSGGYEVKNQFNFPTQIKGFGSTSDDELHFKSNQVGEANMIFFGSDGFYDNVHFGFMLIALNYIVKNSDRTIENLTEDILEFAIEYNRQINMKFDEETEENQLFDLIKTQIEKDFKIFAEKSFQEYKSKLLKDIQDKHDKKIKAEQEAEEAYKKKHPIKNALEKTFACNKDSKKSKFNPENEPEFADGMNNYNHEYRPLDYPDVHQSSEIYFSSVYYPYETPDEEDKKKLRDYNLKMKGRGLKPITVPKITRKYNEHFVKTGETWTLKSMDNNELKGRQRRWEQILNCPLGDLLNKPLTPGKEEVFLGNCLNERLRTFFAFSKGKFQYFYDNISSKKLAQIFSASAEYFSHQNNSPSPYYYDCLIYKKNQEKKSGRKDSNPITCNLGGKPDDISIISTIILNGDYSTKEINKINSQLGADYTKTINFLKEDLQVFLAVPFEQLLI